MTTDPAQVRQMDIAYNFAKYAGLASSGEPVTVSCSNNNNVVLIFIVNMAAKKHGTFIHRKGVAAAAPFLVCITEP